MDVRQLRQFVVLAETLNFRRAAERLHISQPPLSVSIRKLEQQFGTALFERSTRQVRLTDAGQVALAEVRKSLFHLEQAQRHARETREGVRGTLVVGSVGSATLSLIPRIIPPFRSAYPGIDLVLREYPSNRIVEEVEEGRLDLGLVRSPVIGRYQVRTVALERDRLVAVVEAGSRLVGRGAVALAELAAEPFVSYSRDEAAGLHSAVAGACQSAGFLPRVVHETTQIQATISLVAAGLGVALVPALHRHVSNDQVRFLELTDCEHFPEIGLSLVYSPDNDTSVVRHFRESSLAQMCGDP